MRLIWTGRVVRLNKDHHRARVSLRELVHIRGLVVEEEYRLTHLGNDLQRSILELCVVSLEVWLDHQSTVSAIEWEPKALERSFCSGSHRLITTRQVDNLHARCAAPLDQVNRPWHRVIEADVGTGEEAVEPELFEVLDYGLDPLLRDASVTKRVAEIPILEGFLYPLNR